MVLGHGLGSAAKKANGAQVLALTHLIEACVRRRRAARCRRRGDRKQISKDAAEYETITPSLLSAAPIASVVHVFDSHLRGALTSRVANDATGLADQKLRLRGLAFASNLWEAVVKRNHETLVGLDGLNLDDAATPADDDAADPRTAKELRNLCARLVNVTVWTMRFDPVAKCRLAGTKILLTSLRTSRRRRSSWSRCSRHATRTRRCATPRSRFARSSMGMERRRRQQLVARVDAKTAIEPPQKATGEEAKGNMLAWDSLSPTRSRRLVVVFHLHGPHRVRGAQHCHPRRQLEADHRDAGGNSATEETAASRKDDALNRLAQRQSRLPQALAELKVCDQLELYERLLAEHAEAPSNAPFQRASIRVASRGRRAWSRWEAR